MGAQEPQHQPQAAASPIASNSTSTSRRYAGLDTIEMMLSSDNVDFVYCRGDMLKFAGLQITMDQEQEQMPIL